MTGPFNIESMAQQIILVGALGTAAFGLADGLKCLWGGPSRFGFVHIKRALAPFDSALSNAMGDGSSAAWQRILLAHWINGRSAVDQKAIAVSLIQLGLTEETARQVAPQAHVDPDLFAGLIKALTNGVDLTPEQTNILGRFKTSVEVVIDAAYERADQSYRNGMRILSGFISVGLALVAMAGKFAFGGHEGDYALAALVGLIAVPLAPMAKDLASALQTASKALSFGK